MNRSWDPAKVFGVSLALLSVVMVVLALAMKGEMRRPIEDKAATGKSQTFVSDSESIVSRPSSSSAPLSPVVRLSPGGASSGLAFKAQMEKEDLDRLVKQKTSTLMHGEAPAAGPAADLASFKTQVYKASGSRLSEEPAIQRPLSSSALDTTRVTLAEDSAVRLGAAPSQNVPRWSRKAPDARHAGGH